MNRGRTLAAACFAAATELVRAQSMLPPVEWSADRHLRKADFQGSAALQGSIAARSLISIDASWSCIGSTLDIRIRTLFDPNRSTWAGTASASAAVNSRAMRASNTTDAQVLEHEQTHFDIAELFARKIRDHLAQLTDVCTRPGGTVPLGAIVDEYQEKLDEEQARYDRQTSFGLNAQSQWNWVSDTRKALKGKAR